MHCGLENDTYSFLASAGVRYVSSTILREKKMINSRVYKTGVQNHRATSFKLPGGSGFGINVFPKSLMGAKGYALTETTGVGASADTQEESRHYGTAGLLSPNTEAKIVDPVSGTPLPPNQRGELCLRGPFVMKGYFGNSEATTSTLDVDGWLRTGDLSYIDDEGFIFVVDRLKELIKYKGYQVAPAELEALLLCHPEITDAAVIPFPNKEAGQVPMAYIVRKVGSTLSEASVFNFVAQQVAPYKKVRHVAFVSEVPKSAAGKILRKDLIKLATSKL